MLCDHIWQVMLRSSEVGFPSKAIHILNPCLPLNQSGGWPMVRANLRHLEGAP